MHGQADQIQHDAPPSAGFADPPAPLTDVRRAPTRTFEQVPGAALYLTSLVLEFPAAIARGALAYLGAAIFGIFIDLELSAETLAWVAGFGPLAWSVLAFALPGPGRLWSRRCGARRASAAELSAIRDAFDLLAGREPRMSLYVLDDPLPSAAVRGRALIVSRGLVEHEALPAVLAHEAGHLVSLDGVLSEALNRLCVGWPRVASCPPRETPEQQLAVGAGEHSGGWARRFLRWNLRLAAGGFGQRLLSAPWAAYWRGREYAADAHAAQLGQAEDLARYLSEEEMPFDVPVPHLLADPAVHPPTALRVERLLEERC